MTYTLFKEFSIYHDDGWLYKFTDQDDGIVEISYHECKNGTKIQLGNSFHIRKDCIENFISVLNELK